MGGGGGPGDRRLMLDLPPRWKGEKTFGRVGARYFTAERLLLRGVGGTLTTL